ncbi:O-antigen polysaccharide polymerase Wzy [Lutibacter sp. HS1-25]|uniref:O-antigen polymerase n=1 Tax=Lutibacter sp. HS1-25 TaxID=2485000 RepID=UPI001010F41C|nr:O-antigen polymerase [Lutibacter sp. HS1-25]RXP45919.1 O-antigen polysaccharide polymerase Wzy [Lutibacter sp. HS1-25]
MRYFTGLFLGLLTFILSMYVVISDVFEINGYVLIHIIIIAISSFSLFSYGNRSYSLYKIYHIFNLFFIGIAPVLQYTANSRFIGEPEIPYKYKMITSVVFLISTIVYNSLYFLVNSKFSIKYLENLNVKLSVFNMKGNRFSLLFKVLMIFISLICFYMIFMVNNFNILSMLFRGGIFNDKVEVEKSLSLLIDKFFRPLSLVLFIISFMYNRKAWIVNSILFLLFLITAFPLGLGRNAAAGFYLPLLLLFVPIFKKRHFFVSTMIFGLLIVFPFLDTFRNIGENSEFKFGLNFEMFTQLHFDAYITLARVIYHDIITYGYQLLGVFLFFVPRSIWPLKPLSSGQFHANEIGLTFDNLACTYLAEGYINFGYFGVFIFIIFIAYTSAVLDKAYWSLKNKNSYFNVIYVLLLGMFLFVLRGDLMNSYAYTFGLIFTAILGYMLLLYISSIKFKIK